MPTSKKQTRGVERSTDLRLVAFSKEQSDILAGGVMYLIRMVQAVVSAGNRTTTRASKRKERSRGNPSRA
jgi:hypothetical protein